MNEGDGEKTLKGKEGVTLGRSTLLFFLDFTANEGSGIPRRVKPSAGKTVCWQNCVESHCKWDQHALHCEQHIYKVGFMRRNRESKEKGIT